MDLFVSMCPQSCNQPEQELGQVPQRNISFSRIRAVLETDLSG